MVTADIADRHGRGEAADRHGRDSRAAGRTISLLLAVVLLLFGLPGLGLSGSGLPSPARADQPAPGPERAEAAVQAQVEAISARLPDLVGDDGRVRVILELDLGRLLPPGGIDALSQAAARTLIAERAAEVSAGLDRLGAEATTSFEARPYLAAAVEPADLAGLAAVPGIASVAPDEQVTLHLDDSLPLVGAAEPAPGYLGNELSGEGWAVAVIDTGVEREHEFFGGDSSRVVAEACYSTGGDCRDDLTEDTGEGAAEPRTTGDHGTHVAGIAAGAPNGSGDGPAQGVAPAADIVAVQAFSVADDGSRVSYISDLTKGMEFALDQHTATNDVQLAAVNLSLGSSASDTCNDNGAWDVFEDVVGDLRANQVLTVSSAGNGGNRDKMGAPACLDDVVSVGAVDDDADVAWFSDLDHDTDLLAPGVGVDSAVADGGYDTKSGTSMAAPHVAGALAVLREAAADTPLTELAPALLASETLVDDHRSDAEVEQIALLDLPKALTALPGHPDGPDAPTSLAVTPDVGEVELEWDAPSAEDQIVRYDVSSRPGGHTCVSEDADGAPPTTCTIDGLSNGTTYTFTVIASNSAGPGPSSDPSPEATPTGPPSPPTNVHASAGTDKASVSWDAPDDDGGSPIIAYEVTSDPGDGQCTSEDQDGSPPTTCTVEGLSEGTTYTFTVTATNDTGTGPASDPSPEVTPGTVPGPPRSVEATDGEDGRATVSWQAPEEEGSSDIVSYRATSSPGGHSCTSEDASGDAVPALHCEVEGLTNGTAYTFTVTATNDAGTGPSSDPSPEVTPTGVPEAPRDVVADAGDGQVALSWTAPESDGGKPITDYRVTVDDGDAAITEDCGETTVCTVEGLTNGTAYTFTVAAENTNGVGPASPPTPEITPEAPPSDDDNGDGDNGDGDNGDDGNGGGGGGGAPPPPDDTDDSDDADEPEPVTEDGALPSQQPGTSTLQIDGEQAEATVSATDDSLSVSGGDYTLTLAPQTSGGEAQPTVSDTSMQLGAGGGLAVGFDGLEAGSRLDVWLFSDPTLLASATATSTGEVDEAVTIPADVAAGDHTLQVNGVLADGRSLTFNLGVEVAAAVGFDDVDPTSTHGEAILRLAELRIVTGYTDGTYGPGDLVDRGQMAAFLQRSLRLEPGAPQAFSDVGGTTHELAIGAVAEAEIAGGYPDGTYRPRASVTRGQMATFLGRAAGLERVAEGSFSDVDASTHAGFINAVAAAGIASGYADGTYRPDREITREQMASLISNLLDHLAAAG